jgi:hypothetical protein
VWDASILASVIDLREIEMQRIRGMGEHMEHHQCGGSSPLGTKMQGLTAGFEHAIQPDGRSLLVAVLEEQQGRMMEIMTAIIIRGPTDACITCNSWMRDRHPL